MFRIPVIQMNCFVNSAILLASQTRYDMQHGVCSYCVPTTPAILLASQTRYDMQHGVYSYISIAQNESHCKAHHEQHNCVCRQSELILGAVDTTTVEALGRSIALDRDAAHNDEAGACEDEQDASPEVVPLGFLNLERLFELRLLVSVVYLAVVGRWRHCAIIVLLLRWWARRRSVSALLRSAVTIALLLLGLLPLSILLRRVHRVPIVSAAVVIIGLALRHLPRYQARCFVEWVVFALTMEASEIVSLCDASAIDALEWRNAQVACGAKSSRDEGRETQASQNTQRSAVAIAKYPAQSPVLPSHWTTNSNTVIALLICTRSLVGVDRKAGPSQEQDCSIPPCGTRNLLTSYKRKQGV